MLVRFVHRCPRKFFATFYKFMFKDENLNLNRLSKSCVLELLRMHHVTLIFPQLIYYLILLILLFNPGSQLRS